MYRPPDPAKGCIFCRIVAGQATASRILEGPDCLVFMDLFPASKGHTLIIPKPHSESLFETPVEALSRVMAISKPLAEALRAVFEPDGLSVIQLNGAAAGQTVFHYHMHLIPRWFGQPLHIHGRRKAERARLDTQAATVRAALLDVMQATG